MNADTLHRTSASAPPVDPPEPFTEPPAEPVEPAGPSPLPPDPFPPDPFPGERFPNDPDTPHEPEPEPGPGALPPSRPPFQMP